jgi:hypothetical protein
MGQLLTIRRRSNRTYHLPAFCRVTLVVPLVQTFCLMVGCYRFVEAWQDEKSLLSVLIVLPIVGLATFSDFVKRYIAHCYSFAKSTVSPHTNRFFAINAG